MEEQKKLKGPMSLGQIIENTFKIYGKNISVVLILSVVIGGLLSAVLMGLLLDSFNMFNFNTFSMMSGADSLDFLNPNIENLDDNMIIGPQSESELISIAIMIIVSAIVGGLIVYPFIIGGLANVTTRHIRGEDTSLSASLSSTWKKFGKIILATLCLALYYIGIYIIMIIIGAIIGITGAFASSITPIAAVGIVVLVILIMIPLVIVMANFVTFTYQSVVAEGYNHFSAIGRSFKLVSKKFWRVLGIKILIGLIAGGISIVIQIVMSIMMFTGVPYGVMMIVTILLSSAIFPITPIATTVLYFDIRARVEGNNGDNENSINANSNPILNNSNDFTTDDSRVNNINNFNTDSLDVNNPNANTSSVEPPKEKE